MKSDYSGNFYGYKFDEECEGRVRMNMKHGFLFIKYIDENTSEFKVVFNVDMKIGVAQSWVGGMVMSKVVNIWINKTTESSENFSGTEYEKRYIKNPLYRYLAKKLGIEYKNNYS